MSKVSIMMPYVIPLILVGVIVLYYFVNPLQTNFPIHCPSHLLFGVQCPACGFQRALHALLHGDFSSALSYNYFFIFSIPYAFLAIIATWYNYRHALDKLHTFVYHHYTLRSYILLYFGWWIVRNVYSI